jgi:hypothetical protein
MKKIISFLFLLLLFSNCKNDSSAPKEASINYAHLAEAYCKCAQKSIQLNEKMKTLLASEDNEAFQALVPEVSEAFSKSIDCCQAAKTSHTTEDLDKQKLGGLLKKDCSEMPSRLVLEVLKKVN